MKFIRNFKKIRIKEEDGAAAVEFALILPIFSLLVFGIFVFGLIFKDYLGISHAAREGARWAALGEPLAAVEAKAASSAPQINWGNATLTMVGVGSGGAADADQGNPVSVSVSYPLPPAVISLSNSLESISAVLGGSVNVPDTISASATQRVE